MDDRRRGLIENLPNADNLVLGIRPEHVRLSATPAADSLWEGSVYVIEPLGPKTVVHLKVGGDAAAGDCARPPTGRASVRQQHLALDLVRTHIFDGNSKAVIR